MKPTKTKDEIRDLLDNQICLSLAMRILKLSDKSKAYQRVYHKIDKYKAYQRAYQRVYRKTDKYKTYQRAYQRAYRKIDKYKAYRKLYYLKKRLGVRE